MSRLLVKPEDNGPSDSRGDKMMVMRWDMYSLRHKSPGYGFQFWMLGDSASPKYMKAFLTNLEYINYFVSLCSWWCWIPPASHKSSFFFDLVTLCRDENLGLVEEILDLNRMKQNVFILSRWRLLYRPHLPLNLPLLLPARLPVSSTFFFFFWDPNCTLSPSLQIVASEDSCKILFSLLNKEKSGTILWLNPYLVAQ